MNDLILIRYSVDSKTIDKFIRDFNKHLNIKVVNNNSDSNFSSSIANINIEGNNRFREFSAILEALKYIQTPKDGKLFICNDTILINHCSWKLSFLLDKLKEINIDYPTIFGFPDKSFEFFSEKWFLRNGFHIRTDVFALNFNGISFFKEIMNNDFENMIINDQAFNEIAKDFMERYQKLKLGQRKELATFIELFISYEFFKKGLIYDARDINFKIKNSLYKIYQKILNH